MGRRFDHFKAGFREELPKGLARLAVDVVFIVLVLAILWLIFG